MKTLELSQLRHFASKGLIQRCRQLLPDGAVIENEVSSEHISSRYTAVVDLWWSLDNQRRITSVYTNDFIGYKLETKVLTSGSEEYKLVNEQEGQFVEVISASVK